MRTQENVLCPLSDGTLLSSDVYMPDALGRYPAILMRTPYGKKSIFNEAIYAQPELLTSAEYVVIIQDIRGTGDSQGTLKSTGENEYQDGYDSVEWLARQPFCDGRVGMYGLSFFGFTQLAAASRCPPHLLAICPFQNAALAPYGATSMRTLNGYHLYWLYGQAIRLMERTVQNPAQRKSLLDDLHKNLETLSQQLLHKPLAQTPAAFIEGVPLLLDYVELVQGIEDDAFWRRIHRPTDFTQMHVAMFHLTGWFDMEKDRTIDNYHQAMRDSDGFTKARQKLVIGPWGHGGGLDHSIDGYSFGEENSGIQQCIPHAMLRWFDWHIKGILPYKEESPVRYFVMGENRWRESPCWPPINTRQLTWYLHADNTLRKEVPQENHCTARFIYDPEQPYPSNHRDSSARQTLADQRALADRPDVLAYTSPALDGPLILAGRASLVLYAATDAPDTDFACQLVDVHPDGMEYPLLRGLIRAKYRNGAPADPIQPGHVIEYHIDLGNIAYTVAKGNRLKIHVTSSLYPMHDVNPNTGMPVGQSTYSVVAQQEVYHDATHHSRLLLPYLE